MAALSETDRRKILGDAYREIERAAESQDDAARAAQLRATRIAAAENRQTTAGAIIFVGALLLLLHFFGASGDSGPWIAGFGALLLVVGGGAYYLAWRTVSQNRA